METLLCSVNSQTDVGDHEFVMALIHVVVAFVFSSIRQPETRKGVTG